MRHSTGDPIATFLAGAQTVVTAVADAAVIEHWNDPSVLEEQSVAGLVGHLARGAVWAVSDYMKSGEPDGPLTFDSAGAYCAYAAQALGETEHAAVRERGAQVAAVGHEALVQTVTQRLTELEPQLQEAGPDRRVAVIGGAVMRLGDYLQTRIVEQVVHLNDLGRSVGKTWPVPADCVTTALEVAIDVGRRRFGDDAMVRALYRNTGSDVLPVL